jgi:hypothetical protein
MLGMEDFGGELLKLPADMHYLIGPALRYGQYQWDDDIFDFLDRASEAEMAELAALAERVLWNGDAPGVTAFLNEHPMTESDDVARLHYMFLMMDYSDLKFDRAPDN